MTFKIDPRIALSRSTQLPTPDKSRDLKALRESSREFETLFVNEMLKAMRKSVPDGGLFEKSNATEMYREMLDMETAKAVTKGKGLGLGEAMYNQLAHLIENKK